MICTQNRPAVAMLELIFAIVIMGIVLMSAPMLISTATQSTTVALQQEGINEAASRLNMILTYEWDENDISEECAPPVLHVSAGDSELDEVGTTDRRIGVPQKSDTRTFKCIDQEFNASPIGADGGDQDDIDDFDDTTIHLAEDTTGAGGKDYIEQTTIDIVTDITYVSDDAGYDSTTFYYNYDPTAAIAAGDTSNIKSISITLTSTSGEDALNKTITLHGFSCNIGGFDYAQREF
jgi:hypothetical protein